MEINNENDANVHMGRNVAKFRTLKGIKQDAFAKLIGYHGQQSMSRIENRKVIDDKLLEKIAPVLGVSVEILKMLPEDTGTNIIIQENTFEKGSFGNLNPFGYNENFGNNYYPLEQFMEYLKEKDKKIEELEKKLREKEEELIKHAHNGQSQL